MVEQRNCRSEVRSYNCTSIVLVDGTVNNSKVFYIDIDNISCARGGGLFYDIQILLRPQTSYQTVQVMYVA